ncbi:ATP-binding protein [Runella sp.]|uniref:ATP-binding protein n=1 Tax=Runella sp. TaxID=1960881 RepID=UPI003D1474F2
MSDKELYSILKNFLSFPAETEWLEFKEAKNNFDFDDLGKYFAAISNEANLKGKEFGWLIFGVKDNSKSIVGSNYRITNRAKLDSLKSEIANHTNGHTFQEIFELQLPEGRVVMFQIPAAPRGIPITWKGHFYGRNAESLSGLSISEIEQIRGQVIRFSDQDAKELKALGLIEGRKPNYLLTSSIASLVKKETRYIQNRGFDKIYYQDLIIQYLRKFGTITREKTEELLLPKLPDILSPQQKLNKIKNLLLEMKGKDILVREGAKKTTKWSLNKNKDK